MIALKVDAAERRPARRGAVRRADEVADAVPSSVIHVAFASAFSISHDPDIPVLSSPRHIGPDSAERAAMLAAIGVPSLDALIDQTIPPAHPQSARRSTCLRARREHAYLRRLRGIAARNTVARSYIGMGYYDCITPSVILRNVFENPGGTRPTRRIRPRSRRAGSSRS